MRGHSRMDGAVHRGDIRYTHQESHLAGKEPQKGCGEDADIVIYISD